MSKLILITGDLASGKSTLADSLSSYFRIPCFKKDTIKEKYCDELGYENREQNRELSVKAVNFMIDAFTKFSFLKEDIILEANFRHDEMERIKTIAEENKVNVKCFVLRGDVKILYDRFMKRMENRHPAHRSLGLDRDISYFEKYINELRNEEVPFISVIINATNHSEQEVLEIVKKEIEK